MLNSLSQSINTLRTTMSLQPIIESGARVSFDQATLDWLAQCPDPMAVAKAAALGAWLNTMGECAYCGESMLRRDLRHDIGGTYWNTGELTCKRCWHFYDEGTPAVPDFQTPEWPERYVPMQVSPLVNGVLRCKATRRIHGNVEGFNPTNGFAMRVERIGFSDCAEAGSIDLSKEIVTDTEPYEQQVDYYGENSLRQLLLPA